MKARLAWLLAGSVAGTGCGSRSDALQLGGVDDAGLVRGTVVGGDGRPFPLVRILIGGSLTASDANGRFTVANVPAIYDATLLIEGSSAPFVYQGLSRRDPVLAMPERYAEGPLQGYAHLSVKLPAPSTPREESVLFLDIGGQAKPVTYVLEPTTLTERAFGAYWLGDTRADLLATAFRYEMDPTTRAPIRYTGQDSIDLSVSTGDRREWSVSWKPMSVGVTTLSAEITVPAGYSISQHDLFIKPAPRSRSFWLMSMSMNGPMPAYLVPDLAGASYAVGVYASSLETDSERTVVGLSKASPHAKVDVEPGPVPSAPAPDAEGVGVGTALSWTTAAKGACFVNVIPKDPVGSVPEYRIVTGRSDVHLPDLSALGLDFPHGAKYEWSVFLTSAPTADDLASRSAFDNSESNTYAYSAYRAFTTR